MAIDTPHNVSPIAVFDLDGTLADTAGDLVGTLNVILKQEGLAPLPCRDGRHMMRVGGPAPPPVPEGPPHARPGPPPPDPARVRGRRQGADACPSRRAVPAVHDSLR